MSIGFLDASDDLLTKLPAFLSSFDAVVLNDGGLEFVERVLSQVLGVSSCTVLYECSLCSMFIFCVGGYPCLCWLPGYI